MLRLVGAALIVVALTGCNAFRSTEPNRLSVEGKSTLITETPKTIQAVVTVRNTGTRVTDINVTGCPLFLEAFATPERSGEPVWSTRDSNMACIAMVRLLSLAPGDYYDFVVKGTLPSTLPQGRYYLAVWGACGASHVPVGQIDNF